MKVRNVIVDAYRFINDISDISQLDGNRTQIGQQLLNDIISQMNLNAQFAFMIDSVEYQPIDSKLYYTIGLDPNMVVPADIQISRPSSILNLFVFDNQNNTQGQVEQVQFNLLFNYRNQTDGNSIPSLFSYASSYPFSRIEFDTPLSTNYRLVLTYNKNIEPVDINDDVPIPPEYEPSLKYQLALLLAIRYGKEPEMIGNLNKLATDSIKAITANTINKTFLMRDFTRSTSVNNIYTMRGW